LAVLPILFTVLVPYFNTFLFLVLVLILSILILDIGIATWSTNTNIPPISSTAKYRRQQLSVENHSDCNHRTASLDVTKEIVDYVTDTANTFSSLDRYTHLWVESPLCTERGLPSIECGSWKIVFAGRMHFSPPRARLNSDHFEMLTFLRLSKW